MFIEQAAIDSGRMQLAWLLTGLNTPAFNLTTKNTTRIADEPFALLADPRRVAANLSFLKDMNYSETRQKAVGGARDPTIDGPSPRPKPKPKAKPKAKDKKDP